MAQTFLKAAQLQDNVRRLTVEDHGKLRFAYGKVTQVGAGDIGSTWEFVKLPPGRVRILPYLCRHKVSALGSSRTASLGHAAYYDKSTPSNGNPTAAAPAAFAAGLDWSGAVEAVWPVTGGLKHDLYSRDGVSLIMTIAGGTIPDAATGEFLVAYVYE